MDPSTPPIPPVENPGTVVLIGATSGIGRAAAPQLAALGHRVIAVGRDEDRGRSLLRELARHTAPTGPHTFIAGDVSTADGVRRIAARIRDRTSRVDVLVNGAGLVAPRRQVTAEGVELNFAVHHLAPYSMTSLLLPLLSRGSGRVVNISSEGHRSAGGPGLEDPNSDHGYEPWSAYCRSKLANLLFTGELHRRHPRLGVVALHPGMVRTRIVRHLSPVQVALLYPFAVSARRGARPVVHVATDPAVRNGSYYDRFTPTAPSAAACDRSSALRLWRMTERMRGPFGV